MAGRGRALVEEEPGRPGAVEAEFEAAVSLRNCTHPHVPAAQRRNVQRAGCATQRATRGACHEPGHVCLALL